MINYIKKRVKNIKNNINLYKKYIKIKKKKND